MVRCNITNLENFRGMNTIARHCTWMTSWNLWTQKIQGRKPNLRVHLGTLIILPMVYAFPCVFFVLACPHVHMFAPACILVCWPASRVRTCVCVCVCVFVFQESQWLDSVSLLIKDTIDGEMLMIDNLSGSVFHHYSSPPVCKDCKGHPQEVPPWTRIKHYPVHIHDPGQFCSRGNERFMLKAEQQPKRITSVKMFSHDKIPVNHFC